ncbi:MAG: hypothetical protein FJ319_08470 [SAR202 cluster bacterium]|nr:hypothetical protein [SAR202 cluster bacterium]
MTTRDDAHKILDQIPESEVHTAVRFLEYLRNSGEPVLASLLNAPEDDEPETFEERKAVEEGKKDFGAGRTYTAKEILEGL